MLDSLLRTYRSSDQFERAVQAVAARIGDDRDERAAELATLADKIAKTQASIDRYLRPFEEGTMPEKQCGVRVRELSEQLTDSRARHDELADALNSSAFAPPSPEVITRLQGRIADAIDAGTAPEQRRSSKHSSRR